MKITTKIKNWATESYNTGNEAGDVLFDLYERGSTKEEFIHKASILGYPKWVSSYIYRVSKFIDKITG